MIGFSINTDIKRPSKKLVESFRGLPVANINDEMGRMFCMEGDIRPFNDTFLVGTAFTVKAPDADNLMFHKAISLAQPGDVIVVTSIGNPNRSICGEIMMRSAKAKGIRGFIIDGLIRDVDGASEIDDFAVYARGVNPLGPYKNGPGEINVPIAVGRQVVCPGDIIVGDSDGLVVIPPKYAEEVLALAKKHLASEEATLKNISEGKLGTADWVDRIFKERGYTE